MIMKNFCVFFILFATVTLQVYGSVTKSKRQANETEEIIKVPEDNETVDDIISGEEGEDVLGDRYHRPSGGGWQKPKNPCRPGTKSCAVNGGIYPKPTPSPENTPRPDATTEPLPIWTPTLEPEATPEPSATPKPKPTSKPEATAKPKPENDGIMVFSDSNEEGGKPTPRPVPSSPTETPNPKPTPTPSPTLRPTPTASPTPTPPPMPTPTPTKTPIPTPIPTPKPTPITPQKPIPITPPTPAPTILPKPKPSPKPNPDDLEKEKDPENTTSSPAVRECMKKCTFTGEDNPVCGSNGQTYINLGHFTCAKTCGVDVTISSQGPCAKTPTDCPLRPRPSSPQAVYQCILDCPTSSENNPVCGSDGVTYSNVAWLLCAKLCGKTVNLYSKKPCNDEQPITLPTIDDSKDPETTTQDPIIRKCISTCPVTSEYNPVCGSNGFTYTNIGRLQCAKKCGVNVDVRSEGPCRFPPTTKTPLPGTTPSVVARACLSRCPRKDNYDPVCGSDYVTYPNPTHLYCAQYCGSDVTLVSRGACFATPATPVVTASTLDPFKDTVTPTTQSSAVRACIANCPSTPEYNPVCGTDYVTYNNPDKLYCARSCGVAVDTLRPGPCPKQTPATTLATTEAIPLTVSPQKDTPKPDGPTTTQSIIVRDCINSCIATPEYNPVCGTDGVIYSNLSKLNCAKNCGVDVEFSRQGPCPEKVLNSKLGKA